MTAATDHGRAARAWARTARWRPYEILFWLAAAASLFLLPEQHLLLNEIAITGLFALSLDLILGYAGIVSLGHAAFFGLGAYAAGLFARHVSGDPMLGLAVAAAATLLAGLATSFLVLRGSDLTRLMVTLSVSLVLAGIANRAAQWTGGADGLQGIEIAPLFGRFAFDIFGHTAYAYSLTVLFLLFLIARRIVHSTFGLTLRAVRENPLRTAALGLPVKGRLIAAYTLAAGYAGIAGALLAQTTQFVSLDVLAFHRSADIMLVLIIGGAGYLYGGLVGAVLFKLMQDQISSVTPEYWEFWVGFILVALVLVGRERVAGLVARFHWPRPGLSRRQAPGGRP